jgi:hypothetical protein
MHTTLSIVGVSAASDAEYYIDVLYTKTNTSAPTGLVLRMKVKDIVNGTAGTVFAGVIPTPAQ